VGAVLLVIGGVVLLLNIYLFKYDDFAGQYVSQFD
jgi:hypothetical protein